MGIDQTNGNFKYSVKMENAICFFAKIYVSNILMDI